MRIAIALLAATLAVGCGGAAGEPLTVFAAASLTEVFEELDPDAQYNFAGSDDLATQLREGARADVYAAASTKYPDELASEGLVGRPVVFATNRVVLIVPRDNPARIERLRDVARAGVKVVVAAPGVPVGDYTRDGLARAGLSDVLDNVVSEEDDVKGVLAKVALGEADAGFVYQTDAHAAGDDVEAVQLLDEPQARYAAAVVRDSDQPDAAREFLDRLRAARGRQLLRGAGFGLP